MTCLLLILPSNNPYICYQYNTDMSKVGSQHLFQLIKSLSKSEKRYFKIYSSKHVLGEGNKYIELFNRIDAQKEYNEKEIKSFTHLAALKKRLYESILKSLVVYHSEKSAYARIKNQLRFIKIVFDKGLYLQALRIIEKTKKLTRQYDDFLSYAELLLWETHVMRSSGYKGVTEDKINAVFREICDSLDKYRNAQQYRMLAILFSIRVMKHGAIRKTEDIKRFRDIMVHPLMKSDSNALSAEAKNYYYFCRGAYFFIQNDFRKASVYINKALQVYEKKPRLKDEDLKQYLGSLQNKAICLFYLGEDIKIFSFIEKIKQEFVIGHKENIPENLRTRAFYFAGCVVMLVYSRQGDFEKGMKILTKWEEDIRNYRIQPLDKEYEWLYYFAANKVCFGAGKFSDASRFLNKIIQETEGGLRGDLHCIARIISLVVHYEMGDQDLIEYMVKWTYRYLSKRNRLYKFETIVLNFISKKLHKIDTKEKKKIAFTELRKELVALSKDPIERKPLDDFEFVEWLESKIEQRPFAEVVREKANRNR